MPDKAGRDADNKRRYLRLDTIFPIEFQVIGSERREPLSEMREGFTRNIGKGGMGIFAKTLKEHDKDVFNFVPHETKLRLIINIPLDSEPIESFATVEWIERQTGPIVDTYFFGVSYDFINEIEYERIVDYIKWLRIKPRLILLALIVLCVSLAMTFFGLVQINAKRMQKEKELAFSLDESKRAVKERIESEKNLVEAESTLEDIKGKQTLIAEQLKKIEQEKKAIEKKAKLSEEDRGHLQAALDDLMAERDEMRESLEEATSAALTEEQPQVENTDSVPSPDRVKLEEGIYKKFKQLILDGKIQPLSLYVSANRGSIYYPAALFALAEMRYKSGDRSLAEANYLQIVKLYPRSKYALYSSHRLEQLRRNDVYERYSLADLCDKYRLPELFDYRDIEPYYAP